MSELVNSILLGYAHVFWEHIDKHIIVLLWILNIALLFDLIKTKYFLTKELKDLKVFIQQETLNLLILEESILKDTHDKQVNFLARIEKVCSTPAFYKYDASKSKDFENYRNVLFGIRDRLKIHIKLESSSL